LNGHYALCFKTHASFGAHHEDLNEDRPILSATKMYPMTLDSGNIRFMRIFTVVLKIYIHSLFLRFYASCAHILKVVHAVVVFKFECLVYDS